MKKFQTPESGFSRPWSVFDPVELISIMSRRPLIIDQVLLWRTRLLYVKQYRLRYWPPNFGISGARPTEMGSA